MKASALAQEFQKNVEINGQQVECKSACKYLVVWIDTKFREQIECVVKTQYILWTNISFMCDMSIEIIAVLLFYNSFAISLIMYGIREFGSATNTKLGGIEKRNDEILMQYFAIIKEIHWVKFQ